MDFKQIKELIKLVNDSNIGEVLIENDDTSLRIRHLDYQKKSIVASTATTFPVQNVPSVATETSNPIQEAPKQEVEAADSKGEASENTDHLITIKSPMIGTFYRSSSPEKPPYIKVGDEIGEGQVLCIIEAMKLFNEIESEHSGKIIKVLIDNEQPVEYDQPLFLIDPTG